MPLTLRKPIEPRPRPPAERVVGDAPADDVVDLRDPTARFASFGWLLAAIVVLGAVIRVAFVVSHRDLALIGDAWVYHHEARFLAAGHGFIGPGAIVYRHTIAQAGDHPPLFIVLLAVGDLVGIRSPFAQLLVNAALGTATVAIIGLVGRRIGGVRVGLVAALIAACYPGLWSWNGQLLSESVATFFVAATILFAYRYLDARREIDLLGLAIAAVLAGLSRGELLLLVPFVVLPAIVAMFRLRRDGYRVVRAVGIVAVVGLVLVGPWVAYNESRFRDSAPLGTGFGRALDSGACEGFSGNRVGFWNVECLGRTMSKADQAKLDESELDQVYKREALDTMRESPGRVPVVLAARVGRMFHLYEPLQQVQFDQVGEGREWWVSGPAEVLWFALAGFAIAGTILLRRRHRAVFPLVAPVAIAAFGAVISFGTTRYRAPAEPAVVLLAAVGVVAAVRRIRPVTSVRALLGVVAVAMALLLGVGLLGVQALDLTERTDIQKPPPVPHLEGVDDN